MVVVVEDVVAMVKGEARAGDDVQPNGEGSFSSMAGELAGMGSRGPTLR